MFMLNETATLYKRTGQSGGQPVYARQGTAFKCRTQPVGRIAGAAGGFADRGELRIFAPPEAGIGAGDRIAFAEGGSAVATEVVRCRGPAAVHHLEILARREG